MAPYIKTPPTLQTDSDELTSLECNSLRALSNSMRRGDVCSLFLEPIMVPAGLLFYRKRYLRAVRDLCDNFKVLLVFDEVMTTYRTGKMFAFEQYGVLPDFVTVGKGFQVAALLRVERERGMHAFVRSTSNFYSVPGNTPAVLRAIRMLQLCGRGHFDQVVWIGDEIKRRMKISVGTSIRALRGIGAVWYCECEFRDKRARMARPYRLLPRLDVTPNEIELMCNLATPIKTNTPVPICRVCLTGEYGVDKCPRCLRKWHIVCMLVAPEDVKWCCRVSIGLPRYDRVCGLCMSHEQDGMATCRFCRLSFHVGCTSVCPCVAELGTPRVMMYRVHSNRRRVKSHFTDCVIRVNNTPWVCTLEKSTLVVRRATRFFLNTSCLICQKGEGVRCSVCDHVRHEVCDLEFAWGRGHPCAWCALGDLVDKCI